jgi:hypothetical protein
MFSIKNLNIKKERRFHSHLRLLLLLSLSLISCFIQAQQEPPSDTVKSDSVHIIADTLAGYTDSVIIDSAALKKAVKKPLLEAEVKYSSEDSLIFSIGLPV